MTNLLRNLMRGSPRALALMLGLSLLVALELGLRLVGIGDYRDYPDPYASYTGLAPTFQATVADDGTPLRVADTGHGPSRWFLDRKPENGFRVFIFGGSSEAGTPYGYEFSFSHLLQTQLREALPGRHVEVVNMAAPGFSSRRSLHLAREAAQYEPDLYILSIGHNENVEQKLYAHLYSTPAWLLRTKQLVRFSNLYVVTDRFVRSVGGRADGTSTVPVFGQVAAEYWEDLPRTVEQERLIAQSMFADNMARMVRVARQANAKVMVLTQSKNYAGWPATASVHREGLTADELARWQEHMDRANEARAGTGNPDRENPDPENPDPEVEITELRAAIAIDPRYAESHQRLGDLLRSKGDYAGARDSYLKAHNTTLSNFGTTPGRNQVLRELAEREETLFVDMEVVFEEASPNRLVGFNLFVDFLHPNLAGHQLLAEKVLDELRRNGVPEPTDAWKPISPFPNPADVLAANPALLAQELRIRIVAEVLSGRRDVAGEYFQRLKQRAPDDPKLAKIAAWLEGDLPFNFGLMYDKKTGTEG